MPAPEHTIVQLATQNVLRAALLYALVPCTLAGVSLPAAIHAQAGRAPVRKVAVTQAVSPSAAAPAGAWSMPDAQNLVELVIRRIVTQDKPAAVPIAEFRQRAFGHDATLMAVRRYLGRDVQLPSSVYASVADWTDAVDKMPQPECAAADSTCAAPSTVWLAVTKFERGDLPHEMNVWYTTSFTAKPHDQLITSRYSFCERWLRVGGTWKYDGFIRVTSGD